MMSLPRALRVILPALAGVGLVAAVVFARVRGHGAREARIPAGTTLVAALQQRVSTQQNHPGDDIELKTVATIQLDDGAVISQGVLIRGTVTEAKGGGRVAGAPQLTMRFNEIELDGHSSAIHADAFHVQGKNDAAQSAAEIGGGAVAGGVLGRVLGGKGGTLPGAVVGAAIGTGVAVGTAGNQIVLAKGQALRIRLVDPVQVTYRHRDTRGEDTES